MRTRMGPVRTAVRLPGHTPRLPGCRGYWAPTTRAYLRSPGSAADPSALEGHSRRRWSSSRGSGCEVGGEIAAPRDMSGAAVIARIAVVESRQVFKVVARVGVVAFRGEPITPRIGRR